MELPLYVNVRCFDLLSKLGSKISVVSKSMENGYCVQLDTAGICDLASELVGNSIRVLYLTRCALFCVNERLKLAV